MARQVPVVGIPFPSFVNEVDVRQVPVFDTLVDLAGAINASPSITGVNGTGGVGSPSISLSPGALTGVAGTGGVGTARVSISTGALTGVAGTSGVGALTTVSGAAVTLTGQAASAAIGTPTVEIDTSVTLTGRSATAAIGSPMGSVSVTLTGVAGAGAVGSPTTEIDVRPTGRSATAAIGAPTPQVSGSVQIFSGVAVYAIQGIPLAVNTPNRTNVTPTGQQATAAIGRLTPRVQVTLAGLAATAQIGAVTPLETRGGLTMVELESDTIQTAPRDLQINMRWSDDRGASWAGSSARTFGATGNYLASVQWRRLGMARDRIIELSWSAPIPTALMGAIIGYEDSAT